MIFVTVGDSMPFDRLVLTVDEWARRNRYSSVFAQIGLEGAEPVHIAWQRRLEPADFQRRLQECSVVVAHAGMGTILSALNCGKPLLVLPRSGRLRETRNDHQIATAQYFASAGRLTAAFSEAELSAHLDRLETLLAAPRIGAFATPELLQALRNFIQ
jgi:UDP-N-acetylglucosamine transferase subunit ALG13